MKTVVLRVWIAIALTVLAGCAYENAVGLAPSSTRDSLVFVIRGVRPGTPPTLVYGLSVVRCSDERPVWIIAAEGSRLIPDSVRYGQLVPGFSLRAGPEPLQADCYKAIASGAAPVQFMIGPTGAISTRP